MITIRDGRTADVEALARMINGFNIEEGSPGRMTSEGVVDLCFLSQSQYTPVVAEDGDVLVGYALIMRYFDTEPCAWCSYMQDLYVIPDRRGEGVGRKLLASVARSTLEDGRQELLWHVRDHNVRGRAFYRRIGGQEQTPIPVSLSAKALRELAAEAS